MKNLIAVLAVFLGTSAGAESSPVKSQEFTDRVYKIEKIKNKSLISFYLKPLVYQIPETDKDLLQQLQQSLKEKKPIVITVDPVSKKILSVKSP